MAATAAVASIVRKRRPRYALGAATLLCYAVMLLPIFFVCWLSFFKNESLSFPSEGYRLRWFKALWLRSMLRDPCCALTGRTSQCRCGSSPRNWVSGLFSLC